MCFDINNPPKEITVTIMPMISDYGTITTHDRLIEGYTQIGESVEVTFKVSSREDIMSGLIEHLKAEKQKIIADSEVKCNRIDDKIHQLLALPNPDGI